VVELAIPAVVVVFCAKPAWLLALWFLWSPFGLLPLIWIAADIVALVIALNGLRRRDWARAASAAILPVVVFVVFANYSTVTQSLVATGEYFRFALLRHAYLREAVAKAPENGLRLLVWNWGGFVQSKGVVYDDSDEIALSTQSPAWKEQADKTELSCGYGFQPMGDHFYLVGFGC